MVVAISLTGNNLNGPLPPALFEMPYLRSIVLRENDLRGNLPLVPLGVDTLDLRSNRFEYPPPAQLRADCLMGKLWCPGYPPLSCQAFGPDFVVATGSAIQCIECGERWFSYLMTIMMATLFVVALATYLICIKLNDGLVTEGMGTFTIIITHLQTLQILLRLRIRWPKSTEDLGAFLVVDGFTLEAARPECVPLRAWLAP